MTSIPNRSPVAKAFREFDGNDRMRRPPYDDRVVDVMEEPVTFTLLIRGASACPTNRYSKRKEAAEQLGACANTRAI